MTENKIELEDLIYLKDGNKIEIDEETSFSKDTHNVICDEIEDFIKKPKVSSKSVDKGVSFSNVPNSILKQEIDKILKVRNVKEEMIRKHMQFEFDRKMQHINRIKSKTYRKLRKREKIRKEEVLKEENSISQESSGEDTISENNDTACDKIVNESEISGKGDEIINESEYLDNMKSIDDSKEIGDVVIEFNNKNEENEISLTESSDDNKMIMNEFCDENIIGNELEFLQEKEEIVKEEAPYKKETVMPGWDEWAGEGIEIKKRKDNVIIEKKDGIKRSKRKDYGIQNVIINENIEFPDKYKNNIPYGYNKNEYLKKMQTPISRETNSLHIFKRFLNLNNKGEETSGKTIKPVEFEEN